MTSAILPTYNRTPFAFTKGKGSWLVTKDKNKYLDLGAGIAVNILGHAHPLLVSALKEQAEKLWHVSNLYNIPEQEELASALVEKSFAERVFFTNSGTEAAELAIKMARKYWHEAGFAERVEIITFEGAFHGRSIGAISMAGRDKMTKGFGPLLPAFTQIPWEDHEATKVAITAKTAAVIIEPIQGEGGIRQAPPHQLQELRKLCNETGTLLIFDEVQCGMARTGKLFAHEWSGVTPDIMMVAKGIGGGFPLGAVLATQKAAKGMGIGTHGSTYGGNPLGCAIGKKVLETVSAPEFLQNIHTKSVQFHQGLESLVTNFPELFEEVRGQGLMLGLKCKIPNSDMVQAGYTQKLLTVAASDNVVRLLPALNIPKEDISEALKQLESAAHTLQNAQKGPKDRALES